VHALFERIERAVDADAIDDDVLLRHARAEAPGRDDDWLRDRIASVRVVLASPAVRSVYDGPGGPVAVRVEHPFLHRTDRGVQSGFIDRLVLHLDREPGTGDGPDDGPPAVVGATVIDFKTDGPEPESPTDVSDFLDRHRDQMASYRAVIASRYGLDPSRIGVSLIRVDDAMVVEVPVT